MFSFVASLGQVVAPTGPREQIIEAIRLKRESRAVHLAELYHLGDLEEETCALGLPLLHAACAQDLGEVVKALVEKRGANVEARLVEAGPKGNVGDAPLHVCARAGARSAAAALLATGASMEAVNADGLDVQSLATRCLLGSASTDVRALAEENKFLKARLAATTDEAPRTPTQRPEERARVRMVQTTTGVFRKDLILAACSDTAKAFASPATEYHRVKRVFDALCAVTDDQQMESLIDRIKADETLRYARACASSTYDGASLLHAVAAKGKERVVERLLRHDVGFSASETLDTRGRTALHVAAENGHIETCKVLKEAMERETGRRPVGDAAPSDLAGRTPLAWAADRVHDPKTRDELEEQLFAYGDATVLPRTPMTARQYSSPFEDSRRRPRAGFAACATAGWRVDMEDAHCCWSPMPQPQYANDEEKGDLPPRPSLFGVFDGHGGSLCAELASAGLLDAIQSTDAWLDYEKCRSRGRDDVDDPDRFADALVDGLALLDRRLLSHPRLALSRKETRGGGRGGDPKTEVLKAEDSSGTTCVVALVSASSVVVANLGDSAAVEIQRRPRLWRRHPQWLSLPLSVAHKPDIPAEKERIEAFGAKVVDGYVRMGKQGQGTSRSLGDFAFKQRNAATEDVEHVRGAVSAEADIHIIDRMKDSFVVLASDGLWDVLEPQQKAADLLAQLIQDKQEQGEDAETNAIDLQAAVDSLVAFCVTAKSRDNITAVLVDLNADLGATAFPHENHPTKNLFGSSTDGRQHSSQSEMSDAGHPSF